MALIDLTPEEIEIILGWQDSQTEEYGPLEEMSEIALNAKLRKVHDPDTLDNIQRVYYERLGAVQK